MRLAWLILIPVLAGACASKDRRAPDRPGPPAAGSTLTFKTPEGFWTLVTGDQKGLDLSFQLLKDTLRADAFLFETTFSDNFADSELRKLERKGLTRSQAPRSLFMQGLRVARSAWLQTDKTYDITSAGVFESLDLESASFRFKKNPGRLHFGKLPKGMLIGAMASKLHGMGLSNFHLKDSAGHIVIAGDDYGQAWPELSDKDRIYVSGQLLFFAHAEFKGKQKQSNRKAKVVCAAGNKEIDRWIEIGGLTSALAVALAANPGLKDLPLTCQNNVSQGR